MQISALDLVEAEAVRVMAQTADRPAILGLCGAQGSGKSTLASALADRIGKAVVLSIDDIYLTRGERIALADTVHPLLRTRGVPGTHDLDLGHSVLDALGQGWPTPLPRFDKSRDDRAPPSQWPLAAPAARLIIVEGWCVGASPQPDADLCAPINALERMDDPDGVWRRYVNAQLAGPYQKFFSRLDSLVLLAAPQFEAVLDWRIQQENELRVRVGNTGAGLMDDAQIARFIAHYERLTRHILDEMPGRASLTIRLDRQRQVAGLRRNHWS